MQQLKLFFIQSANFNMFTSYFEYICSENRSDNQIQVSIDLYSPEFAMFKEKYYWSLSF